MTRRSMFIYALVDPRTGATRYVGKTRRSLRSRLYEHLKDRFRHRNYKSNWVRQLASQGLAPKIVRLFECFDVKTLAEAERFFIEDYRQRGFSLTNFKEAGPHEFDIVHDNIARAKMGLASKKFWASMSKEQLSAFINKRVAGYRKHLKERSAEEAAARFKKVSEGNKKYQASLTEEQKEARRARGAAWWAGLTEAQRAALSDKLKAAAKRRREAKKLAEASNTNV